MPVSFIYIKQLNRFFFIFLLLLLLVRPRTKPIHQTAATNYINCQHMVFSRPPHLSRGSRGLPGPEHHPDPVRCPRPKSSHALLPRRVPCLTPLPAHYPAGGHLPNYLHQPLVHPRRCRPAAPPFS